MQGFKHIFCVSFYTLAHSKKYSVVTHNLLILLLRNKQAKVLALLSTNRLVINHVLSELY